MNPIELEWQHLKRDGLSGQMVDTEDDFAFAIQSDLYSRFCNDCLCILKY